MPAGQLTIESARPGDVADVVAMIRALAEYEHLAHLCVCDAESLQAALFGPAPAAEVLIARRQQDVAGFALFFPTFSTFLARRGLWLEDLFVVPEHRGAGVGTALLRSVAAVALARNAGRFEWAVLDWNAPAIGFYERLGATIMPDWRIARVSGAALAELAGDPPAQW